MIQVVITKSNKQIKCLEVKGHANSAPYGQDLICAAVSSIKLGLCNAIEEAKLPCLIEIKKNRFLLQVEQASQKLQHILYTAEMQLKTIEESNNTFIQIKTLEV